MENYSSLESAHQDKKVSNERRHMDIIFFYVPYHRWYLLAFVKHLNLKDLWACNATDNINVHCLYGSSDNLKYSYEKKSPLSSKIQTQVLSF